MDPPHLDALAKRLGTLGSRRTALGGILAGRSWLPAISLAQPRLSIGLRMDSAPYHLAKVPSVHYTAAVDSPKTVTRCQMPGRNVRGCLSV